MTVFPTEDFGSKKDPTAIIPSEKKVNLLLLFLPLWVSFCLFLERVFFAWWKLSTFSFRGKTSYGRLSGQRKKRENKEGPFSPSSHFRPFPFLHLHRGLLIPQHRLAENTGSEGKGVGIIKINVAAKRREREAVFSTSSSSSFLPPQPANVQQPISGKVYVGRTRKAPPAE